MKTPKVIYWDEGNGIGTRRRQNKGVPYVPKGSERHKAIKELQEWAYNEVSHYRVYELLEQKLKWMEGK